MNNDETERRLNPDSVSADQPTTTTSTDTDSKDTNAPDDNNNNDNNNDDNRVISGYALKFNTPSKPLGNSDAPFTEVIAPNALDGVDLSNVLMLNDHDYKDVLASTKAGTLKLNVDSVGLHFEATLPDTTTANDILTNIKAGNVSDTSFSFAVADDGDQFTEDDDGNVTRTINKVKSLFDVSICAVGAYELGDDAVKVDTRSYTKYLESKKIEKRSKDMAEKTIINPAENKEEKEVRSYEDYIRSRGEKRDLSSATAGAVIPQTIVTPILNLKNQSNNLASLINRKTVGSGSGTYPVGLNTNAILATKPELEEIGKVDGDLLKGVDYKLTTRAGKIYISNEAVDDSEVDIISEVKTQLNQLVENTDNTNIGTILSTADNFQTATANSLDDVKQAKNKMLNPELNLTLVTNQDGFNYLDSLKDNEGRYMLQPDVTAPTGKSLFGMPIAELSDEQLPSPETGLLIFIGDLQECVFEAYKPQVITQWQQFDSYSQGLSVVLRSDYEVINKNSGVMITVNAATTATTKA